MVCLCVLVGRRPRLLHGRAVPTSQWAHLPAWSRRRDIVVVAEWQTDIAFSEITDSSCHCQQQRQQWCQVFYAKERRSHRSNTVVIGADIERSVVWDCRGSVIFQITATTEFHNQQPGRHHDSTQNSLLVELGLMFLNLDFRAVFIYLSLFTVKVATKIIIITVKKNRTT